MVTNAHTGVGVLDSFQMAFLQNRSISLVDMYIDNAEPTENVGQIHFSLEYDFQNTTLILRILTVSDHYSSFFVPFRVPRAIDGPRRREGLETPQRRDSLMLAARVNRWTSPRKRCGKIAVHGANPPKSSIRKKSGRPQTKLTGVPVNTAGNESASASDFSFAISSTKTKYLHIVLIGKQFGPSLKHILNSVPYRAPIHYIQLTLERL